MTLSSQQILQKYKPQSFSDKLNQRFVGTPFDAYGMSKNTRYSHLGLMDVGFLGSIGTPSFSPPDISNLYAWFDASDITTITKDGSDRVSQWNNKEGTSARDAVQATGGNQPIWLSANRNSLDVIDFDTSSRFMETASALTAISQPITAFIAGVMPVNNPIKFETAWSKHSSVSTSFRLMFGDIDSNDTFRINAGTTITFTETGIENTWQYVTCVYNTTASKLRFGGVEKLSGDAGSNTFRGFSIADNGNQDDNAWTSIIGEIIFYDKLLSGSEISQVESYLSNKWGF